jgi:hypothetical protein
MSTPLSVEDFIPEQFAGLERRREPRVPVDTPARIKCLSPLMSTGPSLRATIVELSRSGMKLRMNRHFELGELVQVIVPEMFYLGTIRYCHRAGAQFEAGIRLTEKIQSSLV